MVKSTASTVSTSSITNEKNETAKDLIHNDFVRYQLKVNL